ncbi:MAG: DUF3842 family protein [Desulfobacterales bacterium]|nr:DUF3842 family protein [Desulfobacterales bacterium]
MKKICIIDGQGGGIGGTAIKRLKEYLGESVEIIALGTNAIATAQMLKSGANKGASGENAIIRTSSNADLIIGPIGIIIANSMMGEVTPNIAEAIANSPARKILIPLTQENVTILGVSNMPLPHLIDEIINLHIENILSDKK